MKAEMTVGSMVARSAYRRANPGCHVVHLVAEMQPLCVYRENPRDDLQLAALRHLSLVAQMTLDHGLSATCTARILIPKT